MKRKIVLLTMLALALTALAGCNQNSGNNSTPADMTNTSTGGQNSPPAVPPMPATNSVGTNAPSNP
jgi:nitrous oxide reductase accessory protein NosL